MGSTGLDKSTNPENPDRFEAEVSSQVGEGKTTGISD
jgi:hypothetical protein